MTLSVCADCTTQFSVGVAACPQCGSIKHSEVGAPKPKPSPKKKDE